MRRVFKEAAAVSLFWVISLAFGVMALDALEWETTGDCRDCLILSFDR